MEYPRLYISSKTHKRVKRAAKKEGIPQIKIGDKIAKAGLQALGY